MIRTENPQQLLESRFNALQAGDYASVYASYHSDAPFRRQFSGEADYLVFARQQLAQIQVKGWRALRQRRLGADRAETLLCMEVVADGTTQLFYELALLIATAEGWRYHSAQKLSVEDYPGSPEQLDFRHFDRAAEKIRI